MSKLREYIKEHKALWEDGKRPSNLTKIEVEKKITTTFQEAAEPVGKVWNYYGGLHVAEVDGAYFWAIENHDGYDPEEITKELYLALKEFENREQ